MDVYGCIFRLNNKTQKKIFFILFFCDISYGMKDDNNMFNDIQNKG